MSELRTRPADITLPAFSRLPLTPDLALLLEALARVDAEDWQAHFNVNFYEGDWSGVPLITASNALSPLAPGDGQPTPRPLWLRDPSWQQAFAAIPVELRSARLLRLGPGGRILRHHDYDLGLPDADLRLHIPLVCGPNVEFMLDGQRIPMSAGECWYLDLARAHSVDNWGLDERVHLVFDCRPNPWLKQAIIEGWSTTPAPGLGRAAEAFSRFCERVQEDPQLSRQLREVTDNDLFISRCVALGEACGVLFTREEVRTAMRQGRASWSQQWKV
jgi:Aspartyl/Asparaginyl beta-hydroxylase/Nif11 domain